VAFSMATFVNVYLGVLFAEACSSRAANGTQVETSAFYAVCAHHVQ
jgi:hypothetical protein